MGPLILSSDMWGTAGSNDGKQGMTIAPDKLKYLSQLIKVFEWLGSPAMSWRSNGHSNGLVCLLEVDTWEFISNGPICLHGNRKHMNLLSNGHVCMKSWALWWGIHIYEQGSHKLELRIKFCKFMLVRPTFGPSKWTKHMIPLNCTCS